MTDTVARLRCLQVDPALFTGPYDAALTHGLQDAGVEVVWATRPARAGERSEIAHLQREELFYRGSASESVKRAGAAAKLAKGVSHVLSSFRLSRYARRWRPDIIHFQWAVLPVLDARLIRALRRRAPVVVTVHDLEPFNASATSRLQALGFEQVLRSASGLVVHTEQARRELAASGVAAARIWRIPHGPMRFRDVGEGTGPEPKGPRWRVVLFGKLQPYKGLDVLVEALGLLDPQVRERLEVIVAGEPLMPLAPIEQRIGELGLDDTVQIRPGRLSEAEAHALFLSADAFVFPYRAIEASGVLYLVMGYGKWLVASRLGAFQDEIEPGRNGALVTPGDPADLARALQDGIGRIPSAAADAAGASWTDIGAQTRRMYDALIETRARTV